MAESGEVPEEVGAEESEPEGPDLSSLNSGARAVLFSALEVLHSFGPEPGTLSDIPQVTIDRQHLADACRVLRDDDRVGAKMLLCLAAVDYPPSSGSPAHGRGRAAQAAEDGDEEQGPPPVGKIQVVYFLQSLEPERTLVLKTDAPYDDPVVPSVTPVWKAAEWYEREAHDLFGISFHGHPGLVPLLLYDEFEGYPGRKEFPFYEYREF